jgi:hypothetical protein
MAKSVKKICRPLPPPHPDVPGSPVQFVQIIQFIFRAGEDNRGMELTCSSATRDMLIAQKLIFVFVSVFYSNSETAKLIYLKMNKWKIVKFFSR